MAGALSVDAAAGSVVPFDPRIQRARNQSGEWEDRTEWVRVTVMGQRAETLANHLRKGSRVYVEGRLEARPWTDQQGQVRAGLEVVASEVQFFNSRQDDQQQPAARQAAPARQQQTTDVVDFEDVPF